MDPASHVQFSGVPSGYIPPSYQENRQPTPSLYAYLSTLTPDQGTAPIQATAHPSELASTLQKVDKAAAASMASPTAAQDNTQKNEEAEAARGRSSSLPDSRKIRFGTRLNKYEDEDDKNIKVSTSPLPQNQPVREETSCTAPRADRPAETPPTPAGNIPQAARVEEVNNAHQEPPNQAAPSREQEVPTPRNDIPAQRNELPETLMAKIYRIVKEWWQIGLKGILYVVDFAKLLLKKFNVDKGSKISGAFSFFSLNYAPENTTNTTINIHVPNAEVGERIIRQFTVRGQA